MPEPTQTTELLKQKRPDFPARALPATQRSQNRNGKMMKHKIREEARTETDRLDDSVLHHFAKSALTKFCATGEETKRESLNK